ncbi:hypothetical protein [Actinoplanes rectilineatus]|uniref:hypothetical protein n=1 Tax=Actinoplanes rectilineatus TaxID=113571 RepID=UPI001FE08FC3|nr:hypothetical protein [Actinoplanes rectilineatus]
MTIRDPGEPGDAGGLPRVRFLLAHTAAHAFRGENVCTFPFVGPEEIPALDMAASLLCPLPLLRRAVAAVLLDLDEDARNPWSSLSANMVPAVAHRLAVPGWVALRRLADESLLDDEAIYYTLGDQP